MDSGTIEYPVTVDVLPGPPPPAPSPWVPMPIEGVFPAPLAEFITHQSRVKDVDRTFLAIPVLAVLSGAIGNSRRLRLRDDYMAPAVVWPVLIASSGDGKSTGLDAAMRPLVHEQQQLKVLHEQAVAAYEEAVRDWKARSAGARGNEPAPPLAMQHLFVSDVTVEAIAMRLQASPRGLLLASDEWTGWVRRWNSYKSGGSDRESFLSMYDARAIKVDRKLATPPTIFIPRAFCAVTGTVQPEVLRDTLTPEMISCGLAARLLLAHPPARARRWVGEEVPGAVNEAYASIISALRLMDYDPSTPCSGCVTLSDAALRLWIEWHDRQQIVRHAEGGGDAGGDPEAD